jgi:putative ABC transport system permease protein
VEHGRDYEAVRDSVEALGYRTFSFADMFEELRRGLLIFDAALGVVGFIALVVASLGIANTMVMSILERYREIGVLKALGADDRDVRRLFLAESAVIGFMGSAAGIVFGWIITRVGQVVAEYFMAKEGAPRVELFDLPFWLIGLALVFGVGVSLLAGLYPSVRATRVDPVQALRHE